MTTFIRPTEGAYVSSFSILLIFYISFSLVIWTSNFNTFSVVFDVTAQFHELVTQLGIHQSLLSQGQTWFDQEEHLYSAYSLSLVGSAQLLDSPVYPMT